MHTGRGHTYIDPLRILCDRDEFAGYDRLFVQQRQHCDRGARSSTHTIRLIAVSYALIAI